MNLKKSTTRLVTNDTLWTCACNECSVNPFARLLESLSLSSGHQACSCTAFESGAGAARFINDASDLPCGPLLQMWHISGSSS